MNRVVVNGRRTMKTYKRHGKPPYSYVGMIALCIQLAPDQKLSLAGIQSTLQEMFTFFKGEYQGWKDSVRHNLSHNDCFYKVQEVINNVVKTKKCDWALDLDKLPAEALKKQESRFAKEHHAQTITEHFGLPCIEYVTPGMKVNLRHSLKDGSNEMQMFKQPTQMTPKRTFTIASLMEDYQHLPFDCRVKHHFPQTMFDNQSPEMALSNLRSLCNDVDTKDSIFQNSCELKNSLCERAHVFSDLHTPRSNISNFTANHMKLEDVSEEEPVFKPVSSVALDLSKSSTQFLLNANNTSGSRIFPNATDISFTGFTGKTPQVYDDSQNFSFNSTHCSSPVMFGTPNTQHSEFDGNSNCLLSDGTFNLASRKRPAGAMDRDEMNDNQGHSYSSKFLYFHDNVCDTTSCSPHSMKTFGSIDDHSGSGSNMNKSTLKRLRSSPQMNFTPIPTHPVKTHSIRMGTLQYHGLS